MIKQRLRVTLRLTDNSSLPIWLVPEGQHELAQTDTTVLRSMMMERLGRVIRDAGLLGVSPTHYINTTHVVRVVADDELEEYHS